MPHASGALLPLWPFCLGALLSYLLGAVPFGLILTRISGIGDIRRIGSGNIGATNVLRTGRKGLAAMTLLLDAGKGALAVVIGTRFGADMAAVAAVFAVLGHMFPVWLRFKGGKGVATAGGVLLAYSWPVGLALLATWFAIALLTRYSSLAALVAAALAPFYAWLITSGALRPCVVTAILAVLVILRHRGNLLRLMRGEEPRIRLRARKG